MPYGFWSNAGQVDPGGGYSGKLLSPPRRRQCINHVREHLVVSERQAYRLLQQH